MDNTEISLSFKNNVSGENKLKEYEKRLQNIYSLLNGINGKQTSSLKTVETSTKNLNKEIQETSKSTKTLKGNFDLAFDTAKLAIFTRATTKLFKSMMSLVSASSSYIENVNLLEVAYSNGNEAIEESSKRIEDFIEKMADVYGFDENRLTRSFGIFKQMANAMQLPTETAENLSEHLVKMSNDIASLYNLDLSRAENALQSALAGQVRPIRTATGADITEKTLQSTIDAIGLDTTINQLSYVEKRLVMIISLTDQLKKSQGDYGRTIESVSNQIRVMKEQWQRLSRSVGNVFYPILEKVLPYLNAVLMVLTEIFNLVASLLGFEMPEFDYSGLTGMSDAANDLIEGMDGASESVDKLKDKMSGLRGFDKLNVISSPKDSGSNASGGAGVNPAIMDAFNDKFSKYNDMMSEVNMKAREIRDKILDWLGFTDKTYTRLKVIGALLAGWAGLKVFKTIKGLVTGQSLLGKVLGTGGLYKTLKKIFGKDEKEGIDVANEVMEKTGGSKSVKSFKVPDVKTVLKGLADFALIVGGVILVVEAVGLFMKIPGAKDTAVDGIELISTVFWGLALVSPPLIAMGVAFKAMGTIGVATFAKGLADFAIIVGGTIATITVIGALLSLPYAKEFTATGIDMVKKVFQGLWDIALPLVGMSAIIVALGLVSPALIPGLIAFAGVIVALTGIMVALGALRQIEGFDWLVTQGGDLLVTFAEYIGKFAGAIVAGFADKAFEGLEKVGTHLTNFMQNAEPFFEGISKVDAGTTQAVDNLASCILKLTAANILDGLTSWFTGGTSFEKFGKDLATFGPYFAEYAEAVKNIDPDVVKASASAASSIAEFANKIPNEGGLLAKIVGDNTLKDFGKMLPEFGKNMKKYGDNIAGLDSNIVKESSDAALSIAEMARKLPNQGGIVSWFTGDNTLEDFSKVLPTFGKNLKKYSDNIKGLNPDVIKNSSDAATSIAKMAQNLPNQGGLISWFTGDNTLDKFGRTLADFGKSFKEYYNTVKGISIDKINTVTDAFGKIVKNAKTIKDNGLSKTMSEFGSALRGAGNDMQSFLSQNFSEGKGWDIGNTFGRGFTNGMIRALRQGTFPTIKLSSPKDGTLQNYKLSVYADGGMPQVGQLFVANEKGPELIGQIGGQSFVANQNQMMDLLDRKLGQAQSQPMNATFVIQVGSREVAREVINDLQGMAKSNGKPITIGG